LLERYYKDFVRAGAKLSDSEKETLKKINAELATLQTQFEQNVLKERNASSIVVDRKEELAGLATSISRLTAAAKPSTRKESSSASTQNTTGQPLLGSLQNQPLRERIMQSSLSRNSKRRRVRHAQYRLADRAAALPRKQSCSAIQTGRRINSEDQTAHDVPTVNKLLADLAAAAVGNAKREAADMQKIVDEDKGGFQISASELGLFTRRKCARRNMRSTNRKCAHITELNHVIVDGVFFAANKEYGLTFKERHDLPVYQSDIRIFEVFDRDGNRWRFSSADYYAAAIQERGRVDECLCPAKRSVRDEARCRESPQHSEAAAGRTDTAHSR